jgi:hypothetical protein
LGLFDDVILSKALERLFNMEDGKTQQQMDHTKT